MPRGGGDVKILEDDFKVPARREHHLLNGEINKPGETIEIRARSCDSGAKQMKPKIKQTEIHGESLI